jgi:hypothetical protein
MRTHYLRKTTLVLLVSLVVLGTVAASRYSQNAASGETTFEFNDVHFHLTNYIHKTYRIYAPLWALLMQIGGVK